MKKIYLLQFWVFLLFCTYLSLTPAVPDALHNYSDKLLHASGYLALFLSCSLAYARIWSWRLIFGGLLSYSVLIEITQNFIPHRGFSGFDILANALGLFLGLGARSIISKAVKKTGLSLF